MAIKEFIEKHPYAIAASVMGIGLLYLLLSSGSSSAATSSGNGLSSDEVAANTALQEAQLQANQQSSQVQASANVAIAGQNTQLAEYQIQAATTENVTSSNNNSNEILAQLSAQTSQLIATLQAQVADTTTAAGVATTQINDNALVTVALAPYENLNADEVAQLNANTANIAGLGANVSNLNMVTGAEEGQIQNVIGQSNNNAGVLATTITDLNNYSRQFQGGTILPAVGQSGQSGTSLVGAVQLNS